MNRADAIGILDSGVGGLSVMRHIRAALPRERLIYVADSAHLPYGGKSDLYIEQRTRLITGFLIEQGACAVVIACNTATAAAAAVLRAEFALPILGMEPALKPALACTKTGVIGVLATAGTLESARFAALLERYGDGVTIVTRACPGLVEQVEKGDLAGPRTRALVESAIQPLLARGADTIVLGCTHYPFLRTLIGEMAGVQVTLIDTGEAVARQLCRRLAAELPARERPEQMAELFWTSAAPAEVGPVASMLWGSQVDVQHLPADVA
jgi:glutamate racemase